jgi:hypothetical protein
MGEREMEEWEDILNNRLVWSCFGEKTIKPVVLCCCMAGKIGTGATFSGNTGACGLTKTDRLPSRRSLVSVTGGFCELLFFRLLGFFPALFGALPNAMSTSPPPSPQHSLCSPIPRPPIPRPPFRVSKIAGFSLFHVFRDLFAPKH